MRDHPSGDPPLIGRKALVTGSTSGLGLAIAQGLAAAGSHVMLHGLEDDVAMESTRHSLADRYGIQACYCRSDLSTVEGVKHLHSRTCAELGAPDILVNNAVVRHFEPIETLPMAAWHQALNVNLSAAFGLIQHVLPTMKTRGWGRFIQMSSVYSMRGVASRVDYVTTKTALIGLTRALAAETLTHGITSNAVCPGSVLTPGTDGRVSDLMRDRGLSREEAERIFLQGKQPTHRFVQSQDVASTVVFLCSAAARDITGQVLSVDGGWSAL